MKKLILPLGLILAVAGSVGITGCKEVFKKEYKECKSDQDKISGCAEKKYYGSGKLEGEAPFKNGKMEGVRKMYYENGNLKEEAPFKNGKTEGIVKVYYESGKLHQEIPYKNDKIEGIAKVYYESGKLQSEIPYKNDKIEGATKVYYEKSGELEKEIIFKNARERIERIYYRNGESQSEISYKDNKIEGTVKWFYPNGNLLATLTYENNKPISGECGNGKILTDTHIQKINENMIKITSICKN